MTKSTPQIKIVNVETGEEIIRDCNAKELAEMQIYQELQQQAQAEAEAKAAEKSALLARLGLTEDELKTILG